MLRGQKGQFGDSPIFFFFYPYEMLGSCIVPFIVIEQEAPPGVSLYPRDLDFCDIHLLHHYSHVKLGYCDPERQRLGISEVLCGAWKTTFAEFKTSQNQKLCTYQKLLFFMSCILSFIHITEQFLYDRNIENPFICSHRKAAHL